MIFNTGETSEELKANYNPEGSITRKAQLRMLDMLLYLDKICKEEKISYRIDGGTVLGAIRHGGFIPWDDDVDIAIEFDDYKKLKRYLIKHPHPQYVLQTHETDFGYMGRWCVLRDIKSEYIQDSKYHNLRKYKGLQVDIFPQSRGNIHFLNKLSVKLCNNLVTKNIGKHNRFASINWYFLFYIIFPFFRIFNRFGNQNTITYTYGNAWNKKDYNVEDCLPYKTILFEGHKLMGPANPIEFLKREYGDFMELPPKESRNNHHTILKIWD